MGEAKERISKTKKNLKMPPSCFGSEKWIEIQSNCTIENLSFKILNSNGWLNRKDRKN